MTLCSETLLKLNYKHDMYSLKYNVVIDYCAIKKEKSIELKLLYLVSAQVQESVGICCLGLCVDLLPLSEISTNTFGQYGNKSCTNNVLCYVCVKHNHLSDDFFGSQQQNIWCCVQRSPARMLSRLKAQSVSKLQTQAWT